MSANQEVTDSLHAANCDRSIKTVNKQNKSISLQDLFPAAISWPILEAISCHLLLWAHFAADDHLAVTMQIQCDTGLSAEEFL